MKTSESMSSPSYKILHFLNARSLWLKVCKFPDRPSKFLRLPFLPSIKLKRTGGDARSALS